MWSTFISAAVNCRAPNTIDAGLPDPKDVIGDPERIDTWAKCLVEENKCTAEIAPLRAKIPEALKSEFSNTTPEERTFIRETSKYLIANKPDQWKEIEEFYDSENKYKEKFDQFLEVAQ
uniref:Uncharacterized protein n=1 Tax=Timema genevievae TaxID=629358 RepID=A0A7R9PQ74_TIMGE|nr:unnamed protein product [Timema genevievae]